MEIELLTADGCGLCDQARAMVERVAPGVTLTPVDIAADEALIQQWGERIPVLRHGERTLEWPFTLLDVDAFFREIS